MATNKKIADIRTIKAVDIILSLLTPAEIALLDIELNGKVVSVFDQMLARWWEQIPIDDDLPVVFRAKAAQILATNKRWVALLAKLREEDFLMKLLEPESFRESQDKYTSGKTTDRRDIDSVNDNVSVIKGIGRNITGQGGTNRDADYSTMWDRTDRERLDRVKIERKDRALLSGETGQEDDTRGTDQEEFGNTMDVKNFLTKTERLDRMPARRKTNDRLSIALADNYTEIEEKKIGIFDLSLNHQANTAITDNAVSQNTFVEAIKRQGFWTRRERMILADTIHNLHNVEFPDVRDKFFKLFDPLFRRVNQLCQ